MFHWKFERFSLKFKKTKVDISVLYLWVYLGPPARVGPANLGNLCNKPVIKLQSNFFARISGKPEHSNNVFDTSTRRLPAVFACSHPDGDCRLYPVNRPTNFCLSVYNAVPIPTVTADSTQKDDFCLIETIPDQWHQPYRNSFRSTTSAL